MAEFKNSIKIGIQLQAKNEVKQELQKMLDNIGKETKLNLDLGKSLNITALVKEVNKLKDSLNLDGVTKSAFASAKVFENEMSNLADSMAKVREESNKKSNSDYLKSEKLQAEAINKTLEEEYQQRLKLNNLKDTLQSKLNISKNNTLVDTSVITNLQNKLNSINTNTPEKEIKELQNSIKNLSSSDSQIVRLQNTISKMTENLSNIKGKFGSTFIDKNATNEVKNYEKELENLKKTLSDLQGGKSFSGVKISDNINKANSSVRDLNNSLKETDKNTNSFGSSLKSAFANVGIYIGTYEAIRKTVDVIRDASQYVIQLDSALVGLKKVTNETDVTYKAFLETAHNTSLELGTQADKFTEATESWAKTGKSLAEATQLAKNTMLLTKVGDVADVDTAQTYLLPALQAFNIEAEKSINLVDKYNNISNNMATDVPKMGEAMARGASSLSVAGNSLEETLALIATASQNTQLSGETIGNGLKSISLRIADFKDEDGEIIPKFEEQMKSLGVTMRGQDGQILSTYNILNQVAQKYGEMDKNTQLMTSQLLGGKYQANVVSSILTDVGELNRAYDLANSSAGSATKEFETYQESIQYSVDQLKENINHLYTEMVNSDALKSFVNGLSEAVQWLDNLDGQTVIFIGTIGSVIVLLTKLSKLNKTLIAGEAVTGLSKFIALLSGMTKIEGVGKLSASFGFLTTSIKSATASAMAFVATPLGAVITAIGVAIGIATVGFTSYKKHQEEVQQQTENLKTSIQSLNETLEGGSTEGVEKDLAVLEKQQDELQKYIKLLEDTKARSEDTFNPTASGASKESVVTGMTQKVAEYKKEIEDAGLHINAFGEIVELTNAKCTKSNLEMIESIKQQTAEQLNNRENLEQAQAEYDNYIETVKGLYNEYQTLSAQENLSAESKARLNTVVQDLQGKYSNLSVTIDENGVAYINNLPLIQDSINSLEGEGMTIDSLSNIRVADQKVNATWQINNTSVTYGEINKRIEIYKAEIQAISQLMQARMASAVGGTESSGYQHMSIGKATSMEKTDEDFSKMQEAQKQLTAYSDAKDKIDKLYNSIQAPTYTGGGGGNTSVGTPSGGGSSGGKGSGSKGGSGSSGQSDAEKWTDKIKDLNSSIDIDRYADLNSQLDILDNHFTDNKNSLDGLTEGTKAYHDKQKEQIYIMKEQASTYSLLAGSYATERDELKQKLSQYDILTDTTGKLTNAEAKLQYQQDLANDMSGNTEAEYNAKKKQIDDVKELEENIKRYREVTESEIPKCTQKWDELNNTIIKTQREQLQTMMDDLASALETKYSKAKEEELKSVEDWYSQRKENLESEYQQDLESLQDEKQSIVDEYDEQIKKLQAQLDKLNDTTDDKNARLASLKAELSLWNKDDSVFSSRKQEELNQSIKDLELELQKDNLQKEIDALKEKQSAQEDSLGTEIDNLESAHDDELDELEKSYDERKQETEDHYDKLLDEQSRYNEASKLMMSNSQEEILVLLQSKSEDWKNVGSLLGENFADGLKSQVEQVMSDLSSLTGGTIGENSSTFNNDSYSSKESNMATSSGNSNSKSDSINGKSYTVDSNGNVSSQYALTSDEIKKILAGYETGGRTPSNISDSGALALLHKNEKILNSEDTNTFDKAMTIINTDLKNFIDKFKGSYNNTLSGYNNLNVLGNTTDLNSMANRAMNNTTNNNSDSSTVVQMDVNIVNNTPSEYQLGVRDIEKAIRTVIKNDGRKFK